MQIVTRRAKQVGFKHSVRVTPRAWANCVVWTRADERRTGVVVSQEARLLWLLFKAAKATDSMKRGMSVVLFTLKRQPRKPEHGAEAVVTVTVQGKGKRRTYIIDIDRRAS